MLVVLVLAAAVMPSGQQAIGQGPGLLRGPYLQLPRQDGMTIVWADRTGTASEVRYGLHWSSVGFDDSAWAVGVCGKPSPQQTNLGVRGQRQPVYIRHAFTLKDPLTIEAMSLLVETGGEYMAYLNGMQIARTGQGVAVDKGLRRIELAESMHLLRNGENVLAIRQGDGWADSVQPVLFALELRRPSGLKRIMPGEWRYISSTTEPTPLDHVATATSVLLLSLGSHYQHHAELTGLTPETTYAYQVMTDHNRAQGSGIFSFRTAPASSHVTFVAFGDSGTGTTSQSAVRNALLNDRFDIAILAGDVSQQDGSYTSYQTTFFQPYAAMIARTPFIPVAGNHDYLTKAGAPLREQFMLPDNAPPADTERYFSFDYGGVHFVGLDSEQINGEQVDWLRSDLASANQPWIVVYLHRHVFGDGSTHPIVEEKSALARTLFAPLFEQYGVDLVISGHNTIFGRTAPLMGAQRGPPFGHVAEDEDGVVYVTTGGGGDFLGPHYTDPFHQPPIGMSFSEHHYTRVTVAGCQLRLEAVDTGGAVRDHFTIDRCQP